jgi:hypothetical protein
MEAAWAAGFFDGEGTTGVNRQSRDYPIGRCVYLRLIMVVTQKDRRPLDRFARAVGVGEVTLDKRGYHQWRVFNTPRVLTALRVLWPHLSQPKREQAAVAWHAYQVHRATLNYGRGSTHTRKVAPIGG